MPKAQTSTSRRPGPTSLQSALQKCQYCDQLFKPQGFKQHERSCNLKNGSTAQNYAFAKEYLKSQQWNTASAASSRAPTPPIHPEFEPDGADILMYDVPLPSTFDAPVPSPQNTPFGPSIDIDSIRTTYHPGSCREPRLDPFDKYDNTLPAPSAAEYLKNRPSTAPWAPFGAEVDFDLAELILKAKLSQAETDALLRIIHSLIRTRPDFNIHSYKELRELWDIAAQTVTPWITSELKVEYENEEFSFPFLHRSLLGWVKDILSDPYLASQCTWDAERLEKWNGEEYVRFVHEPWTGDRFWAVQSKLPAGGKPLAFLVYADKAKWSSFGSKRGYPIIAQLLNLPSHIRNGLGLGGSRVVGFLPILKEDESKKKKKAYVNFKRVIWHAALRQLLSSIRQESFTGVFFNLPGTNDPIHFFPFIMVLSADYEEQTVMGLIRGLKSLYPCPICLVPQDQLSNLRIRYERRTVTNTREMLKSAGEMNKTNAEALLKGKGLRQVRSAFWFINHSSPYRALSFDRMHNYPAGLGGRHIWPWVKAHITKLGPRSLAQLDTQMSLIPSWSGLEHFDKVINVDFSDAKKFESILKQLLFAVHNIFNPETHPEIYMLMVVLRSYVNLDCYAAMNVHTTETMNAGRRELLAFSDALAAYVNEFEPKPDGKPGFNTNFPKAHVHIHAFDDILDKGVLNNYNTMTNEKIHHILKIYYHCRTNFCNVEQQLATIDQHVVASMAIRETINNTRQAMQQGAGVPESDPEHAEASQQVDEHLLQERGVNDDTTDTTPSALENLHLGSKQHQRTVHAIDSNQPFDPFLPTFDGFRQKLSRFLNTNMLFLGINHPDNARIEVKDDDLITEFRYLKVFFESTVDWRTTCNRLRCSPNFYNKGPRYDSVLFDENHLGKLHFVFTYRLGDINLPVAFVQPYVVIKASSKDLELQLIRFRLDTHLKIIPARSIIRGVLLAPTFNNPNHYHIVDVTDPDIFLRVRRLFPDRFLSWNLAPSNDAIEMANYADNPNIDLDLGGDANEDLGIDYDLADSDTDEEELEGEDEQ